MPTYEEDLAVVPSESAPDRSMLTVMNGYRDRTAISLNQNHSANGKSGICSPGFNAIGTKSDLHIGIGPSSQQDPDVSTKLLSVTEQGDVGTGTRKPYAKLHIKDPSAGNGRGLLVDAQVGDGAIRLDIGYDAGAGHVSLMMMEDNGNVGIGTA